MEGESTVFPHNLRAEWQLWLTAGTASQESTVPSITSLGKDENSKSEVSFPLNTYCLHTITKWKKKKNTSWTSVDWEQFVFEWHTSHLTSISFRTYLVWDHKFEFHSHSVLPNPVLWCCCFLCRVEQITTSKTSLLRMREGLLPETDPLREYLYMTPVFHVEV